jgi:hypothetical protein
MTLPSYDAWKTTDPADRTLGRAKGQPEPFRCFDCAWTGKGYIARAAHVQKTGHRTGFVLKAKQR